VRNTIYQTQEVPTQPTKQPKRSLTKNSEHGVARKELKGILTVLTSKSSYVQVPKVLNMFDGGEI